MLVVSFIKKVKYRNKTVNKLVNRLNIQRE